MAGERKKVWENFQQTSHHSLLATRYSLLVTRYSKTIFFNVDHRKFRSPTDGTCSRAKSTVKLDGF